VEDPVINLRCLIENGKIAEFLSQGVAVGIECSGSYNL
jgi:hypothetical protein